MGFYSWWRYHGVFWREMWEARPATAAKKAPMVAGGAEFDSVAEMLQKEGPAFVLDQGDNTDEHARAKEWL